MPVQHRQPDPRVVRQRRPSSPRQTEHAGHAGERARTARGTAAAFRAACDAARATPAHTAVNASRMPIEISSPSTSSGKTPAKNAATMPVTIVATCGVRYFGCTFCIDGGSRPSRDIAMKMRGWPSSDIRITDVRPTMAPILTGRPSQLQFRMRVERDRDRRGDVELACTTPCRSSRRTSGRTAPSR